MKNSQYLLDDELKILYSENPSFFIKHGVFLIVLLVFIVFILCFYVKLPDSLNGTISFYVSPSSATLISRASGVFISSVKDTENINNGDFIGYIESSVNFEDLIYVTDFLDSINIYKVTDYTLITLDSDLRLGDLQVSYQMVLNSLEEYRNYSAFNSVNDQVRNLLNRANTYKSISKVLLKEKELLLAELSIMRQKFGRDSILYAQNILSLADYENSQLSLQQYYKTIESKQQEILNNSSNIITSQQEVDILEKESQLNKNKLKNTIVDSFNRLKNDISIWEREYFFYAPVDGYVSLYNTWNSKPFLDIGDKVVSIIPSQKQIIGKISLPSMDLGKIHINDKLEISLNDYPSEEFGTINSNLLSLPHIINDNSYVFTIIIPNDFTTTYGKRFPIVEGMSGVIKIRTSDNSLGQIMFYEIIKAFQDFSIN